MDIVYFSICVCECVCVCVKTAHFTTSLTAAWGTYGRCLMGVTVDKQAVHQQNALQDYIQKGKQTQKARSGYDKVD